jgi:cyanophycin synthetase
MITVFDKGAHMPLLWTHLIPATLEGRARHNVQNAMFAAGMAFAMGVKLDNIRHGLRTFDATFFQSPGRMNVHDKHGFTVILDYGHNPAAMEAMCTLVDNMAGSLRAGAKRVVALAAPGDRRDEDIRGIAQRARESFDAFVCKRDDNPRGRGHDEVPRMLADELLRLGVDPANVHVVPEEEPAVEKAMSLCAPGDLLLVFGDKVTRCWKQIIYFGGQAPVEEAVAPAPAPASVEVARDVLATMGLVRESRGVLVAPVEDAD